MMNAKDVNDEIIWDNDYIRIVYLGIFEGNNYWVITLCFENKTDKKTEISINDLVINNYIIERDYYCEFLLNPNEKMTEGVAINKCEMEPLKIKSFEDFKDISLSFTCSKHWEDMDEFFKDPEVLQTSPLITFRPVNYLDELENIMVEIEKDGIWRDESNLYNQSVEFDYKRIDGELAGKQGAIDLYLISQGGTYEKVSRLYDKAHILIDTKEKLHIIELLTFFHYNGSCSEYTLGGANKWPHNNNEFRYFLDKYNRIMHLYNKIQEYSKVMMPNDRLANPIMKKANSICDKEFDKVKEERNKIYGDLIAGGEITGQWKSEQQLYTIARQKYEDAIYQYRPAWLGNQSIDIYIPSLNMGLEYQGVQHYKPNEKFGGEEGFVKRRELDIKKKILCEQNGIKLIYWKYDIPITEENFKLLIESNLESS